MWPWQTYPIQPCQHLQREPGISQYVSPHRRRVLPYYLTCMSGGGWARTAGHTPPTQSHDPTDGRRRPSLLYRARSNRSLPRRGVINHTERAVSHIRCETSSRYVPAYLGLHSAQRRARRSLVTGLQTGRRYSSYCARHPHTFPLARRGCRKTASRPSAH